MAVFRQRPWLPWWLAIVIPVIAALAILAIKLMPKQAVIPNLKGQPSMFAAQKLLNKDGFVLAPKPVTVVDASKPAGSIADQSPAAGTKAKKGTPVTVKVYTGTGKATVPNVVGDTPGEADQALRASSLALGTVSPQPLNPKGKISSQIPLANAGVPNGHRGRGVPRVCWRQGRLDRGRQCDHRRRPPAVARLRNRRGGRRRCCIRRRRGSPGGQGPDPDPDPDRRPHQGGGPALAARTGAASRSSSSRRSRSDRWPGRSPPPAPRSPRAHRSI